MNTRINYAGLAAVGIGLLLGASQLLALEITIPDYQGSPNNTNNNGFIGYGSSSNGGNQSLAGLGVNGFGVNTYEDQEVERGTIGPAIAGQMWDLEAFVKNAAQLQIWSGYDLLNGLNGGRPGDLFIKVGGTNPPSLPGVGTTHQNSAYGAGWDYAVDLSLASGYAGLTGNYNIPESTFNSTTIKVYDLNASSWLNAVINESFRSNPWQYANSVGTGQTQTNDRVLTTTGTYVRRIDNAGTGLGLLGDDPTHPDPVRHKTHNVLTLDLGFLGTITPNTNLWFSYTMECGNDSIKGYDNRGQDRVPDGGASALLMGLGLTVLSLLGLKRQKA